MAYFPNGTAGMIYDEQYCWNCVHWPIDDDAPGCPIWNLHHLYNYDQCDDDARGKAIKSFLETLIPTSDDGLGADQCSMFIARENVDADQAEQRRLADQPRKYRQIMAEMQRQAS
jgi:hypothetical protein